MFTTKFTKKSVKGRKPPSGFRFAEGGVVGAGKGSTAGVAGRKPLDVEGTWMDLDQASGAGGGKETMPSDEARRRRRLQERY